MTEHSDRFQSKVPPHGILPAWAERILSKVRERLAFRAMLVIGLTAVVLAVQLAYASLRAWLG